MRAPPPNTMLRSSPSPWDSLASFCVFFQKLCLLCWLRANCWNERGKREKHIFFHIGCSFPFLMQLEADINTFHNRQQKSWTGAQTAVLIYWCSFRSIWELGIFEENLRCRKVGYFRVKLYKHREKQVTLSLNWYNWDETYKYPNRKIWMWILLSRALGVCFSLCFGLAFLSSSSFTCIIFVYHSLALLALTSWINIAQYKYHAQLYYLINKCTC